MCKAPVRLENGTEVACHECSQCRDRAINDWVGRCIAESKTANTVTWAVTLTYGRDEYGAVLHERAVVLTYSDVQKYLKLLRRHGYTVRYFVTGEYGDEKGRCHWHIVLFFEGEAPPLCGTDQYGNWKKKAPDIRFNHHRVDEKGEVIMVDGKPAMWWPHGFSQWKPMHHGSVRYNCKYIQKATRDPREVRELPRMSKLPPLGAEYFRARAKELVSNGLAPQDLFYSWPEVRNKKGKIIKFMLSNRSAELFLEEYLHYWRTLRPERPRPPSRLLDAYETYGLLRVPEDDEWEVLRIAALEEREAQQNFEAKLPSVLKPEAGNVWVSVKEVSWNWQSRAWEAPARGGVGGVMRWVKGRKVWYWKHIKEGSNGEGR